MNRREWVTYGVLVVAIGAQIVYSYRTQRNSEALAREISRVKSEVDHQVAAPARTYRETRIIEKSHAKPSVAEGCVGNGCADDDVSASDSLTEEDVLTARARRFRVEFDAEPIDESWASTAESVLSARVEEAPAGKSAVVHSLRCRSAKCRMEATFESVSAYNDVFDHLFVNQETRLSNGGVEAPDLVENPDGSVDVVLYMSRREADDDRE